MISLGEGLTIDNWPKEVFERFPHGWDSLGDGCYKFTSLDKTIKAYLCLEDRYLILESQSLGGIDRLSVYIEEDEDGSFRNKWDTWSWFYPRNVDFDRVVAWLSMAGFKVDVTEIRNRINLTSTDYRPSEGWGDEGEEEGMFAMRIVLSKDHPIMVGEREDIYNWLGRRVLSAIGGRI